MKSKKRGFTLPELVVVLIIIALAFSISAALVPSMGKANDTAKRLVCANRLRRIGSAVIMYAGTYDNLMPPDRGIRCGNTKVSIEGHPYVLYRDDWRTCDTTIDPRGTLIPLRFACLLKAGFVTDPKVFYCPSNIPSAYKYESYIDPPPWGTLPQNYNNTSGNQWVRMGYTYYPTDSNTPKRYDMQTGLPYREPNCARFDLLDGTMPYATDVIESRLTLSHKSGIKPINKKHAPIDTGINALFKDGHVVYATNPAIFTNSMWSLKENGTLGTTGMKAFYYTIFDMIEP